jgi:hypothetical protein
MSFKVNLKLDNNNNNNIICIKLVNKLEKRETLNKNKNYFFKVRNT